MATEKETKLNVYYVVVLSRAFSFKIKEDSYSQKQRRSAVSPFPWQCTVFLIEQHCERFLILI
jgi:hypothetical protein